MDRLIITDQDLTKQTIEGQPFSYIGLCTGTDIKFVGDWTHVSHFQNNFLRPDWSEAKTRHSYSRFNTFTDAIVSPDAELLDQEMMRAMFEEALPRLKGAGRGAVGAIIAALNEDRQRQDYLTSWVNLSPACVKTLGKDAESAFRAVVGGREHLVNHLLKMASADPKQVSWSEEEEPYIGAWGVEANNWGVRAVSKDGIEYRKPWQELPIPANNHDRVAMAELIEAEIEEAVGFPVTLNILSILPWRASASYGKVPRDWWVQ